MVFARTGHPVALLDAVPDAPVRAPTAAKSNAEQVAKIRTILGELSLEIATADEARAMFALKGKDNVGF